LPGDDVQGSDKGIALGPRCILDSYLDGGRVEIENSRHLPN
jgi:hypothetical protein